MLRLPSILAACLRRRFSCVFCSSETLGRRQHGFCLVLRQLQRNQTIRLIGYMANYSFSIWDPRNKQCHGANTAHPHSPKRKTTSSKSSTRRHSAMSYATTCYHRTETNFCASLDAHLLSPLAALRREEHESDWAGLHILTEETTHTHFLI